MLGEAEVGAALAVKDVDVAKKFYQETLGLSVVDESPGGTLMGAGKGTKVFLYPSEYAGTNQATAAGFTVNDVSAVVADLQQKGVSFEHYDMPGTTMDGDIHVMGDLQAAWFKDPDGNILSVSNMMG